MRRKIALLSSVFAVLAALVPAPAGAQGAEHSASDDVVRSRADGTEIAITIFKPAGASAAAPVPVVLHSHGWAGSRETEVNDTVEPYLDAGFGVVSIDQRGHGDSGGQANVQDPTLETEDIKTVIDRVARLDWVRLDGPNDPVLGAIGGSYGGGYQTMTALDEIADDGRTRFNALAPQITWYDLPESLAPQGVARTAWNVLLYAAGSSMVPQYIHEAFAWGTATGQWPDGTLYGQPIDGAPDLDSEFAKHSPRAFADRGIRIDVPVLVRQGTSDNLFNLNQGLHLFDRVVSDEAREQSYFVAYNGGHALPNVLPPGAPAAAELGGGVDACSDFTETTIEFFRRVFSGSSTDGLLPARYNLTELNGETCLRLGHLKDGITVPVDPTGTGSIVAPAGAGAPLNIPVAEGPLTVTGIPELSGTVTSAALDGRAFLGLSIGSTPADARVVQNNLMPLHRMLPVTDDGFRIELPGVAVRVPAGQSLFLTVSPVSDMFFGHASRTPGAMVLSDVKLRLPVPNGCGEKPKGATYQDDEDRPGEGNGHEKGKGEGHRKGKGRGHEHDEYRSAEAPRCPKKI